MPMPLEYVDLATAKAAQGTRIVTSALVASPWSEAAKGLFTLAGLPAVVVPRPRDAAEHIAWTGIDNVPVVLHDSEPARTNWAAIVALAARLAGPNVLVPADPRARAEVFGLLEMIAGEDGLGWTARLAMIQASFESGGARGFSLPVATYLAKRYGHTADIDPAQLRARAGEHLAILRDALGTADYFGGERPNAVDIYAATFLTALGVIDDSVCPQMPAPIRQAFAAARELLGELVPAEVWAHRTRMFERHLALPIRLS